MIAVEVLEDAHIEKLKGFGKRIKWFLKYRPDLARLITRCNRSAEQMSSLLALPNRDRLGCLLSRLLDETEFLSPHGIRSLSATHRANPCRMEIGGQSYSVEYAAGDSPPGCLEEIPIGAARSGFQLTISCSRRSNAITISTAIPS
jgi:hypothetical protein